MASNKEFSVIVLDVRTNAGVDFKQKSIKCVADMLKTKICAARHDYVSFVLVGTERTWNHVNSNLKSDGYHNILQSPEVNKVSWPVLNEFYSLVTASSCSEGCWLDGLVVAMEIVKQQAQEETKLDFKRTRILLFNNFDDTKQDYDYFEVIANTIVKLNISLIVISDKINYIDNSITGEPQAVFVKSSGKKGENQNENEKYALRLVIDCNATLCNFIEALHQITLVVNKRPFPWNSTLRIGSKITIYITRIIAIKDESNINMTRTFQKPGETFSRQRKYYIAGNEVEPNEEDLIAGYMLGGTPIPYDDSLLEKKKSDKVGLQFIGFAKRNTIPDEYFCEAPMYWIVHHKNCPLSAKKLNALVRAMIKTEMAMLCWMVYSQNFPTPKIVVLIPNALDENKPATLSLFHLSYRAQHHFWDFPTLRTKKTECSEEEVEAIDKLIDAMDLTIPPKYGDVPRETSRRDLLPFDMLPHVYERNLLDVLERKIIQKVGDDDDPQFQELLADKNFVDVFWKVPERIEEQAKKAALVVKSLFPLEKTNLDKGNANARVDGPSSSETNNTNHKPKNNVIPKAECDKVTNLDFDSVREISPAEDFTQLIQAKVTPIENNTDRYNQYDRYAKEMRTLLWKLMFDVDEVNVDMSKIARAMKVYKQSCYDFIVFNDYNDWIQKVKDIVVKRQMNKFWDLVIVKNNLGPCPIGEQVLDEQIELDQFYSIESDAAMKKPSEDILNVFDEFEDSYD